MNDVKNIKFQEAQKFDHWGLWLVIAIVFITFISLGVFLQSDRMIWATLIPGIPVILLLLFTRLRTVISNEGIMVKFFPIYAFDKTIQWHEIEKIFIRKYKPLKEYGGWGLRISYQHGLAYTIAGKYGIQIIFKNGKKLLIGTQKKEEASKILEHFQNNKN